MRTRSLSLVSLAFLAAVCALPGDAFARGFGGEGGNRRGGGGSRGGGGAYRGGEGGFQRGETGGNRGGQGGYRGGESGYHGGQGGYHGGEGGYHGGEGGYHGGEGGYHGGEGGYHGGEGGYHPGSSTSGYHPGGYGGAEGSHPGESGYHPGQYGAAGYHPGEFGAAGSHPVSFSGSGAPSSGQLGGFLGMPASGGGQMAGGAPAGGGGNRGNFSGQNLQNAYNTHPFSQTWAHSQGNSVQSWAQNHPQFNQDWNAAHPAAWTPTGAGAAAWGAAGLGAGAWAATTGAGVGNWLGLAGPVGDTYDYGNTVYYQGGDVYSGDQPVASAGQYYQQASNLATKAPAPSDDSEWMPLGVFAIVEGENQKPSTTVELAVNKQGIVRGNSANEYNNVLPVQGSVDKQTQRVAWTVGADKSTVFDTGLFNLTKSEAPLLVHTGPSGTNQLLMVRLKQNQSGGGASQSSAN